MKIFIAVLFSSLMFSNCGTKNMFAPKSVKDSNSKNEAVRALERGDSTTAIALLIPELPATTQTLIANYSADDTTFEEKLKASVSGNSNAVSTLALLGTAYAQSAGVSIPTIASSLLKIQDKSQNLTLATCGASRISEYFQIVQDLNVDFSNISHFLGPINLARIMWSVGLSLNKQSYLVMYDLVGTFVYLMATLKTYDPNNINKIVAAEAAKMTDDQATIIYNAIKSLLSSLEDYKAVANDTSLDKSITKIKGYISEIDNTPGDTVGAKLRTYLPATTDCTG